MLRPGPAATSGRAPPPRPSPHYRLCLLIWNTPFKRWMKGRSLGQLEGHRSAGYVVATCASMSVTLCQRQSCMGAYSETWKGGGWNSRTRGWEACSPGHPHTTKCCPRLPCTPCPSCNETFRLTKHPRVTYRIRYRTNLTKAMYLNLFSIHTYLKLSFLFYLILLNLDLILGFNYSLILYIYIYIL